MTTQQRGAVRHDAPTTDSTPDISVRPAPAGVLLRAEVGRILTRIDAAEPIRRRVAQDALNDALAKTWRHRAALLEWARPRPGDFTGRATAAELAQRDRTLAAQALACRHKAELLELGLLDEAAEWGVAS